MLTQKFHVQMNWQKCNQYHRVNKCLDKITGEKCKQF